jgi:hypothetical protein
MSGFIQFNAALCLGIALAGCNRSSVQPVPAPTITTSSPVDQVQPPQENDVRVDTDRDNVDIKVDRQGILGDRKVEINRSADGNVTREVTRDRDNGPLRERPLLDRDVDVQVVPGQGVKVDLGK